MTGSTPMQTSRAARLLFLYSAKRLFPDTLFSGMNFKGIVLTLSLGLLIAGCGGSGSNGTIQIRTVNFVRGSSSVNVSAETALLGTNIPYGTVSSYTTLSNFPQTITAVDSTSSTNLGTIELSATNGAFYTLYVYGVENGSPSAAMELVQDSQPAVSAVAASVRVGNFSTTVPGLANVDVYITPTTTQSLTGLTPQFSNVPLGAVDAYLQISGQTYTVWVTPAGLQTQVLSKANQQFNNGQDFSIYVDDGSTAGTTPVLDIVQDTY